MANGRSLGGPPRARATPVLLASLVILSALAPLNSGLVPPSEPPLAFASPRAALASTPSGSRLSDETELAGAPDRPAAASAFNPAVAAAPANWTVLVYMVADNELEPFAIADLNEMEAAPRGEGVNVVVEVDRSAGYDTSNGDWTGTRRYLIAPDINTQVVSSPLLGDLGELNLGDPQTLADFLVWGESAYPALNTMVVLWDHGYGWSAGCCNDQGDNDHLSLAELASAFEVAAALRGRPLDIVAFDACLMQQVEVAYEFAWLADFLVAAEDLEPGAGWPYDAMLAPLAADPSMAPLAYTEALVSAYLDHYLPQEEVMMASLGLFELRTALGGALNTFAVLAAAEVEDPGSAPASSFEFAVADARAGAPKMYNSDYVDLGDFLGSLSLDLRTPPAVASAASAALEALNRSLVAEGHTSYKPDLHGLSIYLPASSVPTRYLATRYATESYWDEFLVSYLSGVAALGPQPAIQVSSPAEGGTVARHFTATLQGTSPGVSPLTLEYKAGWGDFEVVASGPAPLIESATLDAGTAGGPAVLTFRAVDSEGRPSLSVERHVAVVEPPVLLDTGPRELGLAINRTTSLAIGATPRAPYQAFDISLIGLPPGVSSGGTTGSVSLPSSPPPPFTIDLVLSANGSAAVGLYPVELVVRASLQSAVATFLELTLNISRPLPDLAVAPLTLSDELPMPGERVNVTTKISNRGFDALSSLRVVAEFTDGNGTRTELANLSVAGLAPGEGLNLSIAFTATRGTQAVEVRAFPSTPVEELAQDNNVERRVLTIVNFSVGLAAPPGPFAVEGASQPTALNLTLLNLGTDLDTFTVSVLALSDASWQAGAPASAGPLPGRSAAVLAVNVLPPPTAEGGDTLSFRVRAVSNGDPNASAQAEISVVLRQVFGSAVRIQPNEVQLAAGGTSNLTVVVLNTGNGRESFALYLQDGGSGLEAELNLSSMDLAAGAVRTARLTLHDGGLVASERPFALEVVALSVTSLLRSSSVVTVRVTPAPALALEPLENALEWPASGPLSFHFRVDNTGNAPVVAAFGAQGTSTDLRLNLSQTSALLDPGASLVVNGSAAFATPPLAGTFRVTLTASGSRGEANASADFRVEVPAFHDLRASVNLEPASGPRTLVRTLTVENRGNAPENVTLVVGFVPVGVRFRFEPANETFEVPARSVVALRLIVEGPLDRAAKGEIELLLRSATSTLTALAPFEFAGPPPDPLAGWALVGLAAGGAACLWLYATRSRKPRGPPPAP